MTSLPPIFRLAKALQVLADRTSVLPAVGGATEDELRPDADELDDQKATADDDLLDEPYEFGQSSLYVPLTPLTRPQEHLFRFFLDGSMRSFFVGTALEHDRQTPVIVGQVGCAAVERHDSGRLQVAVHNQRNLLLVAFSQVSEDIRNKLSEVTDGLGSSYEIMDIEEGGRDKQDLRGRAQDKMRIEMANTEANTLLDILSRPGNSWAISDGSIRFFSKVFQRMRERFGEGQPRVVSVAKNFSKTPRFKFGRGRSSGEINLWQLLADLPEGNRTLAFRSKAHDRVVSVWYVRLRMKAYMEFPLMGVIKAELPVLGAEPPASDLINKLSNALLAERTVTPHGADRRWHAHLYPIFQAERCVKNAFVGSATLRAGLRWPADK